MRKSLALLTVVALLTGCTRTQNEQVSRYHDDGREKPVVIVTEIFDRNSVEMPWSLAEDLSCSIRSKLMKKNSMFLVSDHTSSPIETLLKDGKNPFALETAWIGDEYKGGEFVTFLELISHKITPRVPTTSFLEVVTPSYNLDMKMRVRIFDLRGVEPELVLQEIVEQTHLLPKQVATMDFKRAKWGRKSYSITPIGIAHSLICRETAKRIEDYVLLAKSRSHAK